ncbi:MAG: YoaK family protein [Sphingobium sp.]
MTRYDARMRALAICLAVLAGYVDALGFIASSGFFVSFMSGNSTRMAVGLASGHRDALVAGTLIVAFVAGVSSGAMVGACAGRWKSAAVLLFVAVLLAVAAITGTIGGRPVWATGLLAVAMGAENAVFEREGEAPLGLTYMTGSLVRIGYGLAGLVTGRRHPGWTTYIALWAGLVGGAIAGAAVYPILGQTAMVPASGVAVGLAIWSFLMTRARNEA